MLDLVPLKYIRSESEKLLYFVVHGTNAFIVAIQIESGQQLACHPCKCFSFDRLLKFTIQALFENEESDSVI